MSTLPMIFGPIGLGCVTFGREIDEAASFALLDHAWERGIRFLDTAAAYGGGASESIVGAWLAARRARPGSPVVATKLLPPYTPATLEAGLTASLGRLRLASVDVLYLHRWDSTATEPATLRALDEFVRSGRVGRLGLSNVTAEQLAPLLQLQAELGLSTFRVVQNNHNLAVRDVDAAMLKLAAWHEFAVVTYSPLAAGFLTGKHQGGAAPGTRFELIPGHQKVYFHDEAFRRLAHLQAVAARTGHAPTHLALAWALHQPGIATVLVGGRTPAHLDQAFAALQFDEPALFAELSSS